MTGAAPGGTMKRSGDLRMVLDTMTFPAAREDLLLHAIANHATPGLIGELRALEESTFPDAGAVRAAIERA